jgi:predicted DNA-binding protein
MAHFENDGSRDLLDGAHVGKRPAVVGPKRGRKAGAVKKIRLTLDLTPAQFARLEQLEEKTGNTKAGVVRGAIQLFEYVVERTLDGYTFRAIDKSGKKSEKVFFLTC